jgi:hypothetical protein
MPGELRDKGMGERWSPPVDGRWTLRADLYVDCWRVKELRETERRIGENSGLRAKLIGEALQARFAFGPSR